ncbi:MAG: lipocalin family protein [Ferruginibacter sp.]
MKKVKLFFLIGTCMITLFAACNKHNGDNTSKTTLQKLQAKWVFQKEYYHEYSNPGDYRDTTIGVTGDYVDFRADGKAYYYVAGLLGSDTATYTLLNDSQVVLTFNDGGGTTTFNDTATIQVLTDNALQLYVKTRTPAPSQDYYEYTDFFTK